MALLKVKFVYFNVFLLPLSKYFIIFRTTLRHRPPITKFKQLKAKTNNRNSYFGRWKLYKRGSFRC